jgi:hypothetical protein
MRSLASAEPGGESREFSQTGVCFRALNFGEGIGSRDGRLPLVIEPKASADLVPLLEWICGNSALLNMKLYLHGGLLFRGFKVTSADDFERVALQIDPLLRDKNPLDDGSRSHKSRCVFGATAYSSLHTLPFHNEDSYLPKSPTKIMFCCLKACASGGETMIADCRRVYEDLPREIVEQFRGKTLPMTRRFSFNLLCQNMETNDNKAIEAACKELGIDRISWSSKNELTIECDLPAVIHHDQTAEPIWFNRLLGANPWAFIIQSCFSVLRTRDLRLRARAIGLLPAYFLYFAPYLLRELLPGKGSRAQDAAPERLGVPAISTKAAYQLARAYWKNAAVFTWKEGDVLVLDNRLVAHGRMPFSGERSILTCVTQATLPKSSGK